MSNVFELIPKDKTGIERVEKPMGRSFNEVHSIIHQLLEWIQDMNWSTTRIRKLLYSFRLVLLLVIAIPSVVLAQHGFSAKEEALKLFNKYKSVIEKKNNAFVENPRIISGDINGDGKEDCIVSFVMTSRNSGNAIIGHESAIYLNSGIRMKVVGAFPAFNFCYTLDHIQDQIIFGKEYECKPPYNNVLRERKFAYVDGKIQVIL
jgi:hypothetical protein